MYLINNKKKYTIQQKLNHIYTKKNLKNKLKNIVISFICNKAYQLIHTIQKPQNYGISIFLNCFLSYINMMNN